MRLDIDSLRTFKTVVELGGVTRAAERLHLTQSAVSYKLARLQARVGHPLLTKGPGGKGGGPGLTEAGRNLLGYAERLVALHDEAAEHFRPSELSGRLRLGATEDATAKKLTAILGRFRRLHPQVTLSIKVAQSLALRGLLQGGALDLAVVQIFADELEPDDRVLWREDLLWVRAEDHPVAIGPSLPFVAFDERCFYRLAAERVLAERGQALDVVLECPSVEGVRAGVRHGLGLALLNRRNLAPGLVAVDEGLPRFPPVMHVLRRGRQSRPGALERSLIETVAQEMREA